MLVALLSFSFVSEASIVSASNVVRERLFPKSPIEICKLIKHPSRYAGKTIRLKAVLVENHTPRVDGGDSYLYGPACRKMPFSVVVEFVSMESSQSIEILRQELDPDGYVRSNVILIGAFHYSGMEKYGHLNWESHSVENALAEIVGLATEVEAQQSLAADGAMACFSSNLFSLQLECCSRAAAEGRRWAATRVLVKQ